MTRTLTVINQRKGDFEPINFPLHLIGDYYSTKLNFSLTMTNDTLRRSLGKNRGILVDIVRLGNVLYGQGFHSDLTPVIALQPENNA
jgi:hypothetical protein